MHSAASTLITEYLEASCHGVKDTAFLFHLVSNNRVGVSNKALTPDGVYKLVRKYSSNLGFEIGPHSLRATAATNALDHQADISKVQEWLGHANISTTRIYDPPQEPPRG